MQRAHGCEAHRYFARPRRRRVDRADNTT